MKQVRKLIPVLSVALAAVALSAAPAGAETGYANICPSLNTTFCTAGATPTGVGEVTVDNSSGSSAGDVWMISEGFDVKTLQNEQKLIEFDPSGNQLAEITNSNFPGSAKPFSVGENDPTAVAVDPADGAVYVAGVAAGGVPKGTITKFNSSGVFQFQITGTPQQSEYLGPTNLAVDPANGDLYVTNYIHYTGIEGHAIDVFNSAGTYLEELPIPIPPGEEGYQSIAVDPTRGRLYVAYSGSNQKALVIEYDLTGTPVNCPDGSSVIYEPVTNDATPVIAVDQSDDHIFIQESDPADGSFIAEYAAPCTKPSARFGIGEDTASSGIGVNWTTHQVYTVNEDSEYSQQHGFVFAQVTLPDVTTGTSATGITRSSALVSGTINPDGTEVTTCEFEYGTTLTYGHTAPCTQALPFTGSTPTTVGAELGFSLPPASLVHYRLKTANANGANYGEDETLLTEGLPPPVVGGLPASGVSQFAATLNGTLQTGEALVNYHFEYGTTTAYGQLAPIPDDFMPVTLEPVPVSQPIQGLQAGTTYHYRLLASSPGGTNVAGPDETFTTLPVPAPATATGGASEVGVGSATLSGTIDPHGWDTSYLFEYGTSTAYGQSWPTVQVEMGALEGPQPVIVNLPNLLPSTTYHYRLVATNGGGTTYGQDMTFTTGEYPAQVIQEPVSLRTLLVPTDEVAKPPAKKKKGKKGKKGSKKHAKGKRKVSRKKKR